MSAEIVSQKAARKNFKTVIAPLATVRQIEAVADERNLSVSQALTYIVNRAREADDLRSVVDAQNKTIMRLIDKIADPPTAIEPTDTKDGGIGGR